MTHIWKKVNKFNETFGVKATLALGTIWCAYAFLLFSLLPLMWADTAAFVNYVSTNVIQLVALAMIPYGTNILGKAMEKRAKEDHLMIKRMFDDAKLEREENKKILQEIKDLHEDLHQLLKNQS
jgi:hypothetical protein